MKAALSALILAGLVACSPQDDSGLSSRGTDDAAQAASGDTQAVTDSAPGQSVLPFIANDYATALAEARQRNVPLFVENWAPW